jgi:AcrR family transcriptional regulator
VLLAVGYDRLTMDAVAAKAGASKATLYRHWDSKGRLVIDALTKSMASCEVPDTGSLAGDLRALVSQAGGLLDQQSMTVIGTVVTAMVNDQWFAAELRRAVIDPRVNAARSIWERAAMRGELRDDLDLDLVEYALGGIVLSHVLLMGHELSAGFVARAIDRVIVPSASR